MNPTGHTFLSKSPGWLPENLSSPDLPAKHHGVADETITDLAQLPEAIRRIEGR